MNRRGRPNNSSCSTRNEKLTGLGMECGMPQFGATPDYLDDLNGLWVAGLVAARYYVVEEVNVLNVFCDMQSEFSRSKVTQTESRNHDCPS